MVHENGGQNESIGNGLICKIWRMIMIYELETVSRRFGVKYGDKSKEIEKSRLEKYKVMV